MRGVIYDGTAARVVEDLEVRAPGPREVIVQIHAAGLCHSDLSVINGAIQWPNPCVLGHEGAGVVHEVGSAVTSVKPGDHVVVATLAACGFCEFCNAGQPTRCRATMGNMAQPFTRSGDPVWNFAAASVFVERTVVRDVQCVKIPDDVPFITACLIGCGVVTGIGAVWNRANVQMNDAAVVYGVGGVGLNCIQALRAKRARRIIAIDTEPAKEALARQFGATDFLNGRDPDIIEQVRALEPFSDSALAGPFNCGGVEWVFDCVAIPKTTAAAMEMLDWGGTCVVVGVPATGTNLEGIPYTRLTHVERTLVGCRYGSIVPQRDIPLIVDLYRRGEIMLDELVSVIHPLEDFDHVVEQLHTGALARGVFDIAGASA